MSDVSRRAFLTRASVVGVGAAAMASGLGSLAAPADAALADRPSEHDLRVDGKVPDDLVVHIRDAKTAEIALIAGDAEYVIHDRKLVAWVLRTFAKSTKE